MRDIATSRHMPKRVLLPPPPAAYFRGPLTAYNHTHRCTTCGVAAHSASQANGNGWPAVNQAPFDRLDVRPTDLPILVPQPADLSPRAASVFTSEFGASAFSSFESMAPTLAQEHWGVHGGAPVDNCEEPDKTNGFWKVCKGGNVMAERNYPCDNLIIGYFGTGQQLDLTGEVAFKRQLYQCMVAQALAIKSNIEQKRAANKFGIVTWQLNEIWPTGGWGSIECTMTSTSFRTTSHAFLCSTPPYKGCMSEIITMVVILTGWGLVLASDVVPDARLLAEIL